MNFDYQIHIPENFHDLSRVWIYQSNRLFTLSEALQIEDILEAFVKEWQTHGTPVKGYANLLFGQFVIIMADETVTGVSGCSTDSSVRIIKQIESLCGVNMFDRQSLAFVIKDKVELLPMAQLKYAVDNGFVLPTTLYFNNLVATKKELLQNWLQPVSKSWLANRISFPEIA